LGDGDADGGEGEGGAEPGEKGAFCVWVRLDGFVYERDVGEGDGACISTDSRQELESGRRYPKPNDPAQHSLYSPILHSRTFPRTRASDCCLAALPPPLRVLR
jgi:hypothetical protein